MKVRTDYDRCEYITPGKIYDVISLVPMTHSTAGEIVNDEGDMTTILLGVGAGCAHLGGRGSWEVVGGQVSQKQPWIKYDGTPLNVTEVDVKLKDGSILCGCLAQSDGDFYWKGCGSEVYVLEHTVEYWRAG